VWLTEHHFIDYGLAVDPATLAAAAASRTRRVRIGLAAAILPFHHPVRLAEQVALIDIISNGRLDVGLGRGNRPAEFVGYNVPAEESRERFDETVEVMLRPWTEDHFRHGGRFDTVSEARVIPKPLQRPHPPLIQACGSSAASAPWPSACPRSRRRSSCGRRSPSARPTPWPATSRPCARWAWAKCSAG